MQYADFIMFYLPTIFKYLVSVTNSLLPLPRRQTNFSHRYYIYLLKKYSEENYTILWRSVGPHHATFYNPKFSKYLSLQSKLLAYRQNYIIVEN
jgi:hypothetical protein